MDKGRVEAFNDVVAIMNSIMVLTPRFARARLT
jgi:hypothetical protein